MLHLEIRRDNNDKNNAYTYIVDHNSDVPDKSLSDATDPWKEFPNDGDLFHILVMEQGKWRIGVGKKSQAGGKGSTGENITSIGALFSENDNILGIGIALFNAAPGQKFLGEFSEAFSNGVTEPQLADVLAAKPVFTDGVMRDKPTTAAQVAELMSHFGLDVKEIGELGSAAAIANTFLTQRLESNIGFGAIAAEATFYLLGNPLLGNNVPDLFAPTALLFKLKIFVADSYSASDSATDLATLQSVLAGITLQVGNDDSNILEGRPAGGVIKGGMRGDIITLAVDNNARDILLLDTVQDTQILDIDGDTVVTIRDDGNNLFLEEALNEVRKSSVSTFNTGDGVKAPNFMVSIDNDNLFFDVVTNFSGGAADTDDLIDISRFNLIGTQLGLLDVSARVSVDTDLTRAPDLFSGGVAGNHGVAFLKYFDGASRPTTFVFIDANTDGDFTAAEDMFLALVGVDDLVDENFIYTVGSVDRSAAFSLAADAGFVTEGEMLTYTVTASEAVAEDTDVVFAVVAGDVFAADQGTANTNLNDFVTGTFNPVTVTIPAGGTTATFSVMTLNDGVTEFAENYSVQAIIGNETLMTTTTLLDKLVFFLTTGADNITGTSGNDVINGFIGTVSTSTMTGADIVDGAGGSDIFNITNASGASVTNTNGALVSGIEVFSLRGSTAADTFAFNAAGLAGVSVIENYLSLGTVTVTNVPGGALIGVVGNGSVLNAATTATWETGATRIGVNISDGTLGASPITLTGAGATSLTIGASSLSGAANTVGVISTASTGILTTTIIAVTSLSTGGLAIGTNASAQSLVIRDGATTVAATATTAATSAVVLGALDSDFASIDASGMTAGGVSGTLSTTTAATFTGGAGMDMITTSTSGQTGAVNAGGGDGDVLTLANATHIDTIAEGAIYQGFEILSSAAAAIDMDLITGSTITGIWLGAAGSNVTDMNATQAANVTVIGALGASTLSIKDATQVGTFDTLSMTISDGDTTSSEALVAGGDITMVGVENIIINAFDDAIFTTFANVTGMVNLTGLGVGDLNITTGAQALATSGTMDFSGLTGTLTYDASAATTNAFAFIGGSNVDIVTDNVIGGNTISTGDGDDVITLTVKTGGATGTTVTGGAGADTIISNVVGNGVNDRLKFNFAAGDSVSDSSVSGISATLTDNITGLNGAPLSGTTGVSAEFDTEVQATAVTAGTTDVVLGTTTVANAGDFFVNIENTTTTWIYQDTDGDKVIEAGEFALSLTGIQDDLLFPAYFTVSGGDLMLVTA